MTAQAQDMGVDEVLTGDPDGAAIVAAREAQLGLERLDNGDGTWSYVGPSTPPADRLAGGLTLRYDGQERFADAPFPATGQVTWVEPGYVLTGIEYDPWTYLNFVEVDARGQRWVVADMDLAAIELSSSEESHAVWDSGAAWDSDSTPGIEWNPDAGATHALQLTSFTSTMCSTHLAFAQNDQNGPMVAQGPGALDSTERLTVRVGTWTGSSWLACSGTLVRDDVVLTAAHCVTNSNGIPYPPASARVCTMENLDHNSADGKVPGCYDVAGSIPAPGWTGTSPYNLEHDWALVFLTRGTGLGAMPITAQNPGAVSAQDDHHHGVPGFHTNCTSNAVDDDCLQTDQRLAAREHYVATGTVRAMLGAYGKWDTSFGLGTSGGPHFLCADVACLSPQLTGVQATGHLVNPGGYPPVVDYAAGPKAGAFKTSVEAILAAHPPDLCPPFGLEESAFTANRPALPDFFDPIDFSPTCQNPGSPGYDTSICAKTLVYLPPSGCTDQEKLVVFLPGTGTGPAQNDFPLEYAAYAGYRTIGLSYANEWDIAEWCKLRAEEMEASYNPSTLVCHDENDLDLLIDYTDECPFWLRQERITGLNDPRSTHSTLWAKWPPPEPDVENHFLYLDAFPAEDSVLYRLLYTLIRLDQEDTTNACQWDRFYDDLDGTLDWEGTGKNLEILNLNGRMDAIDWDRIIIAGWSQGAGHAAWIELTEEVGGLFLLDGPSDMCLPDADDQGDPRGASYYAALVQAGATPRFGVYHAQSPSPPGANVFDVDGDGVPEDPDANRPVAWDNQFPEHDSTPSGLRMPSCDDQPWDATVAGGEPSGTTGVPYLKRSPYPAVGPADPFTQMGLVTDQHFDRGPPPLDPLGECGAHESVALSSRGNGVNCMTEANGTDGAATPETANLFEAYVQGFCALGQE